VSRKHDEELREVLEHYVRERTSDRPSPVDVVETQLLRTIAAKLEHLERSRDTLADHLGVQVTKTGSFARVDQDAIDLMMARAELTREREKTGELRDELHQIRIRLEKSDDRRFSVLVKVAFAVGGAVVAWIMSRIVGGH
jgi:hypothetical protein